MASAYIISLSDACSPALRLVLFVPGAEVMDQSTPMDVTDKDLTQRPQTSPTRHSPAPPLAPLEYLQNQRRGSITDPSLHAASPNLQNHNTVATSQSQSAQFRQQDLPHPGQAHSTSNQSDSHHKNAPLTTRPTSPYIFGDASVQPTESSNRRFLQTAAGERGNAGGSPYNDGDDIF